MQEKAKLDPIESFPQESGKDHEMIIMDPNKILIGIDNFKNLVREDLINRDIRLEKGSIKSSGGQWQKRME